MRQGAAPAAMAGLRAYHLVFISGAASLYLGALLSDAAYARSYEIQWLNFAAWLIAGAMVFTGLALAWSLADVVLGGWRVRPALIRFLLLLAIFVLGLLNSFMHARDAWATMPGGLIMSVATALLALIAVGFAASGPGRGIAA